MIKFIDSVPKQIADQVEQWVTSTKIPWFYFDHTLGSYPKGRYDVDPIEFPIVDSPRFTHYFFPNSRTPEQDRAFVMPLSLWCIQTLLPGFEPKRIMGNLTFKTTQYILNLPHVDSDDGKYMVFLYYVNDSDGCTMFFEDKKEVFRSQPKKGTGVLFNANTIHAGQLPVINNTRYVINMIFQKRD